MQNVALVPERLPRVVQYESAAERRMLTAWGRWYASPGGDVREFRRLRMGRAGERDAPSNDALAFVVAAGQRAEGNVYRDLPVSVVPDECEPSRVRVVEVVLASGVPPRVVVDASPADIRRAYRDRGRGRSRPGVSTSSARRRLTCVNSTCRRRRGPMVRRRGAAGPSTSGWRRRTPGTPRARASSPTFRMLTLTTSAWRQGS